MGPDEDKKLRQLLLMKRKLPEPAWNLFARTTKRFSALREPQTRFETQASQAVQQQKEIESTQQKQDAVQRKAAEKAEKAAEKEKLDIFAKSILRRAKAKKEFKTDINKENTRLNKLRTPGNIIKQADKIKTMQQNYEAFFGEEYR